ncbi:unnamed protein product [Meganyctiphanes norvegica]|uniref:Uncharacterized protein n=1 Tax=Meganyctiphanes norvegica TaxID=48144 RepID=A0AAV2QKG9_MEGNR
MFYIIGKGVPGLPHLEGLLAIFCPMWICIVFQWTHTLDIIQVTHSRGPTPTLLSNTAPPINRVLFVAGMVGWREGSAAIPTSTYHLKVTVMELSNRGFGSHTMPYIALSSGTRLKIGYVYAHAKLIVMLKLTIVS